MTAELTVAPATSRKPKTPREPKPPLVLTPRERAIQGLMATAALLFLAFALNMILVSHVQSAASQQQLRNDFAVQLAEGVAPVDEGDVDRVLLRDGAPVAILDIPAIGLQSVVVEGSSSGATSTGPGHRRDTVLPGQRGLSVVMGRASAYGGPFSRIDELQPGDTFSAITGQGEQIFAVIGVRLPGDPEPAREPGESRLVLETAGGGPYMPAGVVRVDATLVSEVQAPGARQTTAASLPAAHREMATDTGTVWALVFALQGLIAFEFALLWAGRRVGRRQLWVVFVPVGLLVSLIVTDQVMRLLPNLL